MTSGERVAIVGAGPRAAYALERLATLGSEHCVPLPTVDVIAPGSDLGPAEIYRAGQPDCFRLNVASAAVHAWNVAGPPTGPSLDQWRARWHPGSLPDQFPPRALVGQYLAEVGRNVRARVPGARIDARVLRVERAGPKFAVQFEGREGARTRRYGEVLLAVGHARAWSGALAHRWRSPLPLARVYPAAELLRHTEQMGGGADPLVVVRGAALTGLDAALLLTQPEPSPARVLLVSRSGRLMAPKTDPSVLAAVGDPELLVEPASSALRDEGTGVARAVADAATRILTGALGARVGRARAASEVSSAIAVMRGPATEDPREWLRHRLAIATGQATADGAWALGQAWRLLYPELVARQRRLAHRDGPPLGWADYRAWSVALERLAFGPPPVNAGALLDLMDQGQVQVLESSQPLDALAAARGASLVVDAVLAPAGIRGGRDPLVEQLRSAGLLTPATHGRGARIDHEATCLDPRGRPVPGLAAVGRITEDVVLGNDTLVRSLHPELDHWARRVLGIASAGHEEARHRMSDLRAGCQGVVPLPGRLLAWQRRALNDAPALGRLIDEHGSPLNLIDPAPLAGHAEELVATGRRAGVEVRVFFARKANKALALVDAAAGAGHGIDVSSQIELDQVLARGVEPERIILTAAVKPRALLELALREGVPVSLDGHDELALLMELARVAGIRPRAVLRLCVGSPTASRFGLPAPGWIDLIADGALAGADIQGVHVHQHGYAAADRVRAIAEAVPLIRAARAGGHPASFIDIGGGIPMSYLDAPQPWEQFWDAHREGLRRDRPLTWKGHGLGLHVADGHVTGTPAVYPMWQSPTRGEWLTHVLSGRVEGGIVAEQLAALGLRLNVEPGRALLDGCGLTVARVQARKDRGDGTWLVLLAMNRTQCRSAAQDFLLDPVLVPHPGPRDPTPAIDGYLVGAYCIEDELLTHRRLRFPLGVAVGDLVCFVNTAGYQMHILESASHQIPLARNLVPAGDGSWALDDIDRPSPATPDE